MERQKTLHEIYAEKHSTQPQTKPEKKEFSRFAFWFWTGIIICFIPCFFENYSWLSYVFIAILFGGLHIHMTLLERKIQKDMHETNMKSKKKFFKICPYCGEKLQLTEPICTKCGKRLIEGGPNV